MHGRPRRSVSKRAWPGSRKRASTHGARSATAIPLQAVEDALRTFGADEIIISTHPEGRSNWLERDVVTKARERFTVPITHVIVDLENERRSP